MSTNVRLAFVFSALLFIVGGIANAQYNESPVSLSFDATLNSQYVWRGLQLTDEVVLQPSLTLSHDSGLNFNVWGNMDLTDTANRKGDLKEIDYTLDYSFDLENVGLTAGIIHYTFPDSGDASTTELFISAGYDGDISPFIEAYFDIKESKGLYVSLGLATSHPIEMGDNETSIDYGIALGYGTKKNNEFYYFNQDAGFTDISLFAELPINVSNNISITPHIVYSSLLTSGIRDGAKARGLDRDNFVAGITASIEF